MKKVGIVGGIGPESTVDYYTGIIKGYKNITQSDNCAPILIDSINLAEVYVLVEQKRMAEFADCFVNSIKALKSGGAEFAIMAANTAHIVYDEVKSRSELPLISIVEEVCKDADNKGYKRVILFGTGFTMSNPLYPNAFDKFGIKAFVPDNEDQKIIHNIIFPNLQEGIILPEDKISILKIANKMIIAHHADALVLGCTELPLIIKSNDLEIPLIDTTQIHINAIVDFMLK